MSPIKLSRLESAVRIVLTFQQAYNRHDPAAMLTLMSPDCRYEASGPAPDGAVIIGTAALADYWEAFFAAAPQVQLEIEEIFGLGLRVIMCWQRTAGAGSAGLQPVRGIDIFKLQQGVICTQLSYVKG